jgi:hypothetical protein
MKNFLRGIIIVAVGLYVGMTEDVFAMKSQEFLNKMEWLCRLQQNVQTAQILNAELQKSEKSTTVEFLGSCFVEIVNILLNQGGYSSGKSPSPGELLHSGVVDDSAFKAPLDVIVFAQETIVTEVLGCIDHALVGKLFPRVDLKTLSPSQRSSLVVFVSQIDTGGKIKIVNPYLLCGAINTLAEETDELSRFMLNVMIEMVPKDLLEGSELI